MQLFSITPLAQIILDYLQYTEAVLLHQQWKLPMPSKPKMPLLHLSKLKGDFIEDIHLSYFGIEKWYIPYEPSTLQMAEDIILFTPSNQMTEHIVKHLIGVEGSFGLQCPLCLNYTDVKVITRTNPYYDEKNSMGFPTARGIDKFVQWFTVYIVQCQGTHWGGHDVGLPVYYVCNCMLKHCQAGNTITLDYRMGFLLNYSIHYPDNKTQSYPER